MPQPTIDYPLLMMLTAAALAAGSVLSGPGYVAISERWAAVRGRRKAKSKLPPVPPALMIACVLALLAFAVVSQRPDPQGNSRFSDEYVQLADVEQGGVDSEDCTDQDDDDREDSEDSEDSA